MIALYAIFTKILGQLQTKYVRNIDYKNINGHTKLRSFDSKRAFYFCEKNKNFTSINFIIVTLDKRSFDRTIYII